MTHAHVALLLIISMQSVDASASKVLASTDAMASEAGVKRGSCWMLSGDLKAGDRISLAQVVEAPCRTREGNKVQEARRDLLEYFIDSTRSIWTIGILEEVTSVVTGALHFI